jgi:hypothetical protein
LSSQETAATLLRGHLCLQLGDLRLSAVESVLLQQAALHQQVERIGLSGNALVNQRVRLRVLGHAAGSSQAQKEIIE